MQRHLFKEINQEFQRKIEEDVKLASSKEERVAREVKHLHAQHQAFVDSVEEIRTKTNQNVALIHTYFDRAAHELNERLDETEVAELKYFNGSKSDLEFVIAASQSFTRYGQGLIRSGSACDITQAYDELQLRAKELLKGDYKTSYTHPVVEVSPSDIFEKLYVLWTEKSKGF